VGGGDLKYRMLKATIRSRAATVAFRVLHPELGMKLAAAVSSTEDHAGGRTSSKGRAAYIEAWARTRLAADPDLAFVVCGHSHVPALVEVDPGRWYLNAGDWITHFTYITVPDAGPPELRRWERQAARP
jgi:UDP-2,3-diacylglucosamine hydrolase